MMVGLQGSGKTTTTAKLAKPPDRAQNKRKVLMASLDTRRPAAMEQLRRARRAGRASRRCRSSPARRRSQIARRALQAAKLGGYDVVMLDTAGRTTLDEALMARSRRDQEPPPTRMKCCWSPTR